MLWNAQMLLARASGDASAAAGVRDFLERWRQGRVVRARARRASDPARPWLPWQQRVATDLAHTHARGWSRHVSSPLSPATGAREWAPTRWCRTRRRACRHGWWA